MEAEFSLGELFEDEIIREWSIEMQRRPRDNHTLRRGLLSGAWVDLHILSRSIHRGQVRDGHHSHGVVGGRESRCCFRPLGDGGLFAVHLQGLLAFGSTLNGKPYLE
jgi:hypothetical protein